MKSGIKLIFVYNADGDPISSLIDAVHKVAKPSTYKCRLCMITYGAVSMKKEWRNFIRNLKVKTAFLHRDEFQKKHHLNYHEFPAVFIEKENVVRPLIKAREINKCKNIGDLKKLIKRKIIKM